MPLPADLPDALVGLFQGLTDHGFNEAPMDHRRPEDRDRVRFVRGDGAVRAARRGSEWILELSYPLFGSGWVDAAAVRSALDHTSVAGPYDLVGLSNFVSEGIDGRFAGPLDLALCDDIDRLEVLRRRAEQGLTAH